MASTLLDKLKKKPNPLAKEEFKIVVPARKKVVMSDKRGENRVNRKELLRKMREPKVKQAQAQQAQAQAEQIQAQAEQAQAQAQAEQAQAEQAEQAQAEQPQVEPKAKKPTKKKGKKLKIVGIDKGTISTLPAPSEKPVQPRKTPAPDRSVVMKGKPTQVMVGETIKRDILPKDQPKVLVRADHYYLSNRQIFVSFINNLFKDYRAEILREKAEAETAEGEDIIEAKCNRPQAFVEFELLTHQKIVRDYLNLYTPYRGLLLFHGLGSGKTCSSIAIAEGMKSEKPIIVLTPASLRRNYIEELKKCGDPIYKKRQYWEFVPLKSNESLLEELMRILNLTEDFIRANGGAWMVNVKKEPNYEELDTEQRANLDKQINEMIRRKYQFINYNGLRTSHLDKLSSNGSRNPFDNAVVIIDEAHNFISRIVNKIRSKKTDALSMRLYEFLLSAQRCRVVLLTGTPIINYPNEIGILFNILRGYIKTWTLPLNVKTAEKVNEDKIKQILNSPEVRGLVDYVDYKPSTKQLKITRNPFGFTGSMRGRSYLGVSLDPQGDAGDDEMMRLVEAALKKNQIEVIRGGLSVARYKALPDQLEEFQNHFVNIKTGDMKNKKLFQRRILGLASYFRSAQEELMPAYDIEKDLHVQHIPMSDYQFGVYEAARVQERKLEKSNSKKKRSGAASKGDLYDDSVSTYRIFSRAFCNFVFPRPIGRPLPREGEDVSTAIKHSDEDTLDGVSVEERLENTDGRFLADEEGQLQRLESETTDESYEARIKRALNMLRENAAEYLSPEALKTYSPKFLTMYENIVDSANEGLHLVYSQFRTLEGIGIFSLILEANGFAKFKLKKTPEGSWDLDMTDEELAKPAFALYTGTEDPEEKEIIRNIFNSDWGVIPTAISAKLRERGPDNIMGQVIKVFMITASGAEGISLKNCRFVHITEPYWHPVRVEQVIGRAARICSHKDLPSHLRTLKVFMYLMTFSEKQLADDGSIELRLKDKSKLDRKTPLTSDEALFEISNMKNEINKRILTAVKEAAIDCSLHSTAGSKEQLVCFSFGRAKPSTTQFAISPSLEGEEADTVTAINTKTISWKAKELRVAGKLYALKDGTNELYEYDSYQQALKLPGIEPRLVANLIKNPDGSFVVKIIE